MSASNPSSSARMRLCKICARPVPVHLIRRCSICHRHFCRSCGVVAKGRRFCSKACGRFDAFEEEVQGRRGEGG
jgi:hypothetical protein